MKKTQNKQKKKPKTQPLMSVKVSGLVQGFLNRLQPETF